MGCSGLTEVKIPNSVTVIGANAFADCTGLTSVTIPGSVTSIGQYAFRGCDGLRWVTIPPSVKKIEDGILYDCSSLTDIVVDNDNQYYCSSEGVLYNKSKTELKQYPQGKVDSEFVIPNTVTEICNYAFFRCSNLTKVTIPGSVTYIGVNTFRFCSGLTELTLPNSLTTVEEYAFSGCNGLTELVIPNSVTSVGNYAFSNCNALTKLTIGNSLKSIGEWAFYLCRSLTEVTIPSSVTEIGVSAFRECSGLTSVTIPGSVTSIGEYAFDRCNLTSVYYEAENPIAGAADIFDSSTYEDGTLYVRESAIEKCEQIDPWKGFAHIQAYDFSGVEEIKIDESLGDPENGSDVYTMQGVCIKRNAMQEDINALHQGIYIIGGKKVLVK